MGLEEVPNQTAGVDIPADTAQNKSPDPAFPQGTRPGMPSFRDNHLFDVAGRRAAGIPVNLRPVVAARSMHEQLDLRDLIKRPASTFFIRAIGDSMIGVGIRDGDLLVVDRAEMPLVRRVVVASTPDGLTVKVLVRRRGRFFLAPANERYPLIPVTGETEIWGVVIHVIHSFV